MRRIFCRISLVPMLFLAAQATAATFNLDVSPARPDGTFALGQPVEFRVTLRTSGSGPGAAGGPMSYTVTTTDGVQLDAGNVAVTPAKPGIIKAKTDKPGFVYCKVTFQAGNLTMSEGGSAVVAPDQIKPTLPPPDDFDAFWQAQRKLLVDAPAEPKLTPATIKEAGAGVTVADVEVPTLADYAPMRGYLAKPKNAKPKSLPAIVFPQSFGGSKPIEVLMAQRKAGGVPDADATWPAVHGSDGIRAARAATASRMIALDFNLHGVPNGQPSKTYGELSAGEYKDSLTRNASDRETTYLRGFVLRLMRAIDLVAQQPEWDGRTIIVDGGDVGGGLALMAPVLDPRVSLCIARTPSFCDMTGGPTRAGWPRVVPANAPADDKTAQAMRYYDAVNFATRIKVPTYVIAGFAHPINPPTGVYAAYNSIPADTDKHVLRNVERKALQAQIDGIIRKHVAARSRGTTTAPAGGR